MVMLTGTDDVGGCGTAWQRRDVSEWSVVYNINDTRWHDMFQ